MNIDHKYVTILGVRVNHLTINGTSESIREAIIKNSKQYICCMALHSIMECQYNQDLIQVFNNSSLNTPDGMGVVFLLKFFGYKNVERVYGPDLLLELCKISNLTAYKHYFLGSTPSVLEKLKNQLIVTFPYLNIVGTNSPPFRPLTADEDSRLCKEISDQKPDILWVGLGSPKQEVWMYEHQGKIDVPVMIGVGAAFDFLSGNKPQAPRWIQRSGFEWLFRLLSEPRRLWKRYLLGYPKFIYLLVKHHVFKVPFNA